MPYVAVRLKPPIFDRFNVLFEPERIIDFFFRYVRVKYHIADEIREPDGSVTIICEVDWFGMKKIVKSVRYRGRPDLMIEFTLSPEDFGDFALMVDMGTALGHLRRARKV